MNQLRRTQKDSNGKLRMPDRAIQCLRTELESVLVPSTRLENRENRLDSWKEIAVYLDREVRTVQRWEKREHLPVHRHLHHKIGSIFAFKDEIDNWRASRSVSPENPVYQKTNTSLESDASLALSEPSCDKESTPLVHSSHKRSWAWANVDSIPAIIYFDPDAVAFPLKPHSRLPKTLQLVGIPTSRGRTLTLSTRRIAAVKSWRVWQFLEAFKSP